MNKVSVIGMGMSFQDLTGRHLDIISSSDVLIGGSRHLDCFPDFKGEKIEITRNLKEIAAFILNHQTDKKITVLASGDPLFYGIGSYLAQKLGRENMVVFPNVSTVAAAFACIGEPWQDAALISLHGRDITVLHVEKIRTAEKAAVLTDRKNTPVRILSELEKAGVHDFKPCVIERIGEPDQGITFLSADDRELKAFKEPNILLLLKENDKKKDLVTENAQIHIGMPEDSFDHQKGLITKPEVRAVSLSKLKLESSSILWDLGAGSGSISIEAGVFIQTGKIFAVEKNPDRIRDIESNTAKFCASAVTAVHAELPRGLETLPAPDRVFIGGGGRYLEQIVEQSAGYLKKKGIMVINTVLLDNVAKIIKTLDTLNFSTEIVQIQVNCGHKMPWNLMLKSYNPVFIISGEKR